MPSFYEQFKKSFRTVEQGADTVIWLAISKEVRRLSHRRATHTLT